MTKFYYVRDHEWKPKITVCLIDTELHTARGIAICSDIDNPCKGVGKFKAFGRARKALVHKSSSLPIQRPNMKLDWEIGITHKSMFDPELSTFEKKLLGKKEE
jgi:hypothetical protein